jgi:hypothetical protein
MLHCPGPNGPGIAALDPPLLDRGCLFVVVLDRYAEEWISEGYLSPRLALALRCTLPLYWLEAGP